MFSLIITIVSIALVVALVAATMYHGGDTMSNGRVAALAATIANEGAQVQAAYAMNLAIGTGTMQTVPELVSGGFLKSQPTLWTQHSGWGITKLSNGQVAMLSQDTFGGPTEGQGLKVCQELDKQAGRTPRASFDDYPDNYEDAPAPFGCKKDEGWAIYYKF